MSSLLTEVPACWIKTKADERAVALGYQWDQAAANHVCAFFPKFLRLSTGQFAGCPFVLEAWETDFLSRLYGWRRSDGTRRFREAYVEICKKNGKTSLLAGLSLYAMKEEPGAEVYQGALNGKQADVLYREAAKLVKASPKLRKYFRVKKYNKTIVFDANDARLESLTADAEAKDGVNSSLTIFDEIHRWGGNRRLYDVMRGAGAARLQPLIVSLTTAGDDSSLFCRELHDIAVAIAEGDDSNLEFLGIIHGLTPEDDVEDEENWKRANPALGSILSLEDFRTEYEQAKRIPARLKNFLRLRLGLWQKSENVWLDMPLWDRAGDPALRELDWWRGRNAVAGLDLSSVKDLTSLTLTTMDDGVVSWHSTYFLPQETVVERSEGDGVPYDQWVAEGHALETEGNATDFEAIRQRLNELRDLGINITAIAIDPWNAAHLATLLIQDGFEVYFFRQNFANFNGPCQEVERRLLNGSLRHDFNPITRWCAGNCTVKLDPAGNMRPTKAKAQKNRVDGLVSGIMALGVLTSQQVINPGCEFA